MQPTVKSTSQFSENLLRSLSQPAVHIGVWAPFLGYQCIEITSSSKIQTIFFRVVLPKLTRANTMRQSWDFPWMEKSKVFRTKFALTDRATSKIIKIISFEVISFDSAFMRNCSETISRVCFVLNSRDDIQNLHYALYRRYIFTSHSLNAAFISMYLPHQPTIP